jgi:hypothetical protein
MKFKMNRTKYAIAIFTILGISGLLYASSFMQYGVAQNQSNANNATSQKKDVGSIKDLQNLTKGNQELLKNSSNISNSSVAGISKESLTTKPNMSNAKIQNQSQSGGQNQSQSGAQSQSGGQNQSQSGGQNQSQSGGQNQSQSGGQNKGPLDQLLGSIMGKK